MPHLNIERTSDGDGRVSIGGPGVQEHLVNIVNDGADPLNAFRRLPASPGTSLARFVFGGRQFHERALTLMRDPECPLTWVHGDGCSGEQVAGLQNFAVSGADVETIRLDGRAVGRVYADNDATYAYLGGLLPTDPGAGRPEQAYSLFEQMERALAAAGMTFAHVVRTWLCIEQILDWYDDFNASRNAFFEARGVFDGLVPASTGIGAANPHRAAVTAGALALLPRRDTAKPFAVPSPLQCPALDYRSSFSRAVEVHRSGRRDLYVSGTASIEPDGTSAHLGDVDRQIALSLDVVGAILSSRNMAWTDVTRAIAYFRDMRDVPRLAHHGRARGIPPLPLVPAHAAVCRDGLLFEIEVDAVRAT